MERYAVAGHVPWCAIGSIRRLLRTVAMMKTCERNVDKKVQDAGHANAHTQILSAHVTRTLSSSSETHVAHQNHSERLGSHVQGTVTDDTVGDSLKGYSGHALNIRDDGHCDSQLVFWVGHCCASSPEGDPF